MVRKRKFLIGGLIIFLAIGYLGYMGLARSATYYYTLSELTEQGNSIYGERIRVNGIVSPGSVEQKAIGRQLVFTITDQERSLPVVYQGVVPDTFKAGGEVVVEGRLNSDGIFQANTILAKCPSKYEPE